MRNVLIALTLIASVSAASAQTLPTQQIFLQSQVVEVPSQERLNGFIAGCNKVWAVDRGSCRVDMEVYRNNWNTLAELGKTIALAKLVGSDYSELLQRAEALRASILKSEATFRRDWAEVVGDKFTTK
jgi:hypothetical protein